ncbi:SURF1 family protein [Hoeflea sp.]|uniref:SURF1 family protein n=1 Tax=Hoeflea sp. TaxID=1940281 RepID=UPI002AFEB9D0|nr:SURF1 family protein [Hoeflea sp.]
MTDVTPSSPPRRLGPVTLIVILAALAILLALGTWQVKRLYWKQDLLAKIETRMVAAPAGLEEIIALKQSGEDIEYRRVSLTGQFRHAAEQFFFSTLNGRTGYFVYTPFETEAGQVIFVNRGFVEVDFKDPATRSQGQVAGTVSVVGLARDRLDQKPSWVVPDNDLAKNIFYWKDLDAMAVNAGIDPQSEQLLPFFIDADESPNPGGQPIGGVTQVNLPNSHLQYAITWYGLALALLGVTGALWWRGRRGK